MKHKIANKIVILSVLLALTFSALGVTPAKAYGQITHAQIALFAITSLPAGKLKTLLTQYQGIVYAGALYPDSVMVDASGKEGPSEQVHWPEFVEGYTDYVRTMPAGEEKDKAIAFLMGIIAHQQADIPLHWEFLQYVYDVDPGTATKPIWDPARGNQYTHGITEVGIDIWIEPMNAIILAHAYSHPSAPLLAGYHKLQEKGFINNFTQSDVDAAWNDFYYLKLTPIVDAIALERVFLGGLDPYTQALAVTHDSHHYMTYPYGGVNDAEQQVANRWLAAWKVLNDPHYTGTYYVKTAPSGGSDTTDCDSWANACTLQRAFFYAVPGTQIWVAAGTYKPGAARTDTFLLPQGVDVYGGFDGDEDALASRHGKASILSGDIGVPNNSSDNSYHVVTAIEAAKIFDGFTVTDGNADGDPINTSGGGFNRGGGMQVNHARSGLQISNVIFQNNSAENEGGGLFLYNDTTGSLKNVVFMNNTATNGGGLANWASSPTLTNVTFSNNSASDNGSGIYNAPGLIVPINQTGNSNPKLNNVFLITWTPLPNINGWYNTDVTVDFQVENAQSGKSKATSVQILTERADQFVTVDAVDLAGNSTSLSVGPINIDKTSPSLSGAASTPPNAAGWYNSNVKVQFTCSDTLSGIPDGACPPNQVLTGQGKTVWSIAKRVEDKAGNISGLSNTIIVKVDKTAPTILAAVTKSPDKTGWYKGNVKIHFTCSDALSGIPQGACPPDQVVSSEGTASLSQTVTDIAGNIGTSSIVTVEIDKSAPTLKPAISPSPVLLNSRATATANAIDEISGVASQACGAVNTRTPGKHSVTCTATDHAGNTTTQTISYTVNYGWDGFLPSVDAPPTVNTGKAGLIYPVKWQLKDANGDFISDLSAIRTPGVYAVKCGLFSSNPTSTLEFNKSNRAGLRYDRAANQFIYNWSTPTKPGCYRLDIKLKGGQLYQVYFNLK